MAYCQECGEWFTRRGTERWKTLCVDCWKATKKAEVEDMQDRIEYLEWQNQVLSDRLRQVEHQPMLTDRGHGTEFLRIFPLLVKLAHPDRHGGHQDAHEVLCWANGFRDDLKNGRARACNTGSQG